MRGSDADSACVPVPDVPRSMTTNISVSWTTKMLGMGFSRAHHAYTSCTGIYFGTGGKTQQRKVATFRVRLGKSSMSCGASYMRSCSVIVSCVTRSNRSPSVLCHYASPAFTCILTIMPSPPAQPSIPVELLGAIVAQIDRPSDLLCLRLTSSTLCSYATPLAFRSIRVVNKKESVERLLTLLDHKALAQHVREIVYQYEEVASGESGICNLRGLDEVAWVHAFSRIALFPALESLVLSLGSHHRPLDLATGNIPPPALFQLFIFAGLLNQASVLPSSLKVLRLYRLLPVQDSRLLSQAIVAFCAPLTLLVIDTAMPLPYSPLTDARSAAMAVSKAFHPGVLSSSLVSLTMHHAVLRSADAPVPLTDVHLPYLKYLSLQRIYFWNGEGIEAFILRHSATLTELRLFLCPMVLSKSIYPANPPTPSWRLWTDVWEGFATEFNVLEKLVTSECRDSLGLMVEDLSEWYYASPFGAGVLSVNEGDAAGDAASLKRLHEVVEARSVARQT
ncbi:hypothetical protein BC834DRAFT_75508 [Gloeopeniophorella convolvens]|nr:hypothetical protein BC834DRAFT_75508 [Gloeopeniophorella convolvens]